jgi:DNA-binding transcriptional ArsR family regulator
MKSDDADMDLDQAAAIYDALGHPIRLAILRALQKEKTLPLAELRKRVSDLYIEVDTRNVQFHLYKMQSAGVVASERAGGREMLTLKKDVGLRVRDWD